MNVDTKTLKEITKNKLEALKKTMLKYKNFRLPNGENKANALIREYGDKHNITNTTLLRRFANPTKDPDPLASTLVSLAYKFPIVMKEDWVSKFPEDFRERYAGEPNKMIERKGVPTRLPGWVGCKKELVDYYLNSAQVPDEEMVKIIDMLYHTDIEKVKSYLSYDWEGSSIDIGRQTKKQNRVRLNTPIIEGLRSSDIIPLTIKILSPGISCSDRINKIYQENKDKLAGEIPKKVSLVEQASTLRSLLDPKERMIPVLPTILQPELYQHTTSLFSNNWQAMVTKQAEEEGEIGAPINYDIEDLCIQLIYFIRENQIWVPLAPALKSLTVQQQDLFDLVESYIGPSCEVNYIKALSDMTAENTFVIHARHCTLIIRPQLPIVTAGKTVQQIHFVTKMTEGIVSLDSGICTITMRWATFRILLEVVIIFNYFLKWDKGKCFNPATFVNKAWEEGEALKLRDFIMDARLSQRERQQFLDAKKLKFVTVTNYRISTNNAPFVLIIEDNATAAPAQKILTYTVNNRVPPVFLEVNGSSVLNISNFISERRGNGHCTGIKPLILQMDYSHFLQMVEFQQRYISIYRGLLECETLVADAIEMNYPHFGSFFLDQLSEQNVNDIGFLCTQCIRVLRQRRELEETPVEMLAFYMMWANSAATGNIILEYTFRDGSIIDLNFTRNTQHQRNALWVNEDDEFMMFNIKLSKLNKEVKDDTKLFIIQGQVEGFKLFLTEISGNEKIFGLDAAKRFLTSKRDGTSCLASHMGLTFEITRDRSFTYSLGRTGSRLTLSVKRAVYLEPSKLNVYGVVKKPRKE